MISAWKKFIARNDQNSAQNNDIVMPPGVQKLDKDLQKKFSRGVNYNMKVIIKGDNRVGKTSLFLRLKGYGFDDNYNPTESLNVTSIDWNYKATDDVVKIDLWEAVDTMSKKSVNFLDLKMDNDLEGTKATLANNNSLTNCNGNFEVVHQNSSTKITITSTKLSTNGDNNFELISESARRSLAELSENLDVYRGSNAVILVMDMTKLWTFKYIQQEILRVPKHLPVLVVANHRDQGHHRTVSTQQVRAFLDSMARDPGDGIIMYTEASMKNGYGLKLINKFFNIPFLKLQESSLVKQLEMNRQDFMTTQEELQLMQESIQEEYEQYLELQTIRRRQEADAMSPISAGLNQLDESIREQIRNSSMSSDIVMDNNSNVKSLGSNNQKNNDTTIKPSFVNDRLPSIVIGAKHKLPETKTIQIETSSQVSKSNLSEEKVLGNEGREGSDESDDEEDEIRANPLVEDYQSDVDSDDQIGT